MNDPILTANDFHADTEPAPVTGHVVTADPHPWTLTPPTRLPDTVDELLRPSTLLTPEQQADLVRQAHLPTFTSTPGPGTTEVQTADGRTMHVYIDRPADPVPTPVRQPYADKWAVNTAVLSLSLSTGAFIAAHALHTFAIAAAAFVAALQAVAAFALVLAIVLGVIVVAAKNAGRPQVHVDQRVTNHIQTKGVFTGARIDSRATTTGGR